MADGRFNSGNSGSSPRSSLSRARFGRRSAGGRPTAALGLRNRRGWGQQQHRRLAGTATHLPWTCLPAAATHRLRRTTGRTVMPVSVSAQNPEEAPLPSEARARPSCRLPSPTLAPSAGQACRATHVQAQAGRGAGRSPRRSYLVQRPGKPRAPRPQSSGPGSREQEAAERRGGTRLCRRQRRSRGSGGTCWLGRTGRTARSWTRDCSESGREDPLSHAGLGGARGGV